MAMPEVVPLADVGAGLDPVSPSPSTRPTRGMTPSGRVQDTLRSLENAPARASKRITTRTTRVASVGNESERVDEVKSRSSVETAKSMMQRVLEMLAKMGNEMVDLKHRVSEQTDTIRKLSATVYKQSTIIQGQEDLIRGLEVQIQESKEEFRRKSDEHDAELKWGDRDLQREVAALKEQLDQLTQKLNASGEVTLSSGARATFADIARTLPASPPTSLSSVVVPRKQQTASDRLQCTIDTSRVSESNKNKAQIGSIRQAIETEMRAMNGQETWRSSAETKLSFRWSKRLRRRQPWKVHELCETSCIRSESTIVPRKQQTASDPLQCTIDTSRVSESNKHKAQIGSIRQAIETEMRAMNGQETWRCAAVMVKEAAQKTALEGSRVMRDQLYPVRVDNANRTAILDAEGNVLPGAIEALSAENRVTIGKISWLSKRESGKAYGSVVV
ncbi:hypothetical protein HIM_10988 [Hirsutella minnesotensis 3608]|uniref:Uncharacterized protein n=1 Tax=Hirsutella minnesotensis 3608 TaxID=1043627 RepID=A0A0F7ZJG1_9HYPO|nr:hypothetical protein HIM_10988 [Hirsutella minnesotensis 3608]